MKFEKVKKLYSINRSYFKLAPNLEGYPKNPFECFEYFKQHNELPYKDSEQYTNEMNTWCIYECFIAYQKRVGVSNSQYFTPQNISNEVYDIYKYLDGRGLFNRIENYVDVCCGFGCMTASIPEILPKLIGYDGYELFKDIFEYCNKGATFETKLFNQVQLKNNTLVFANPPYEMPYMLQFLTWLSEQLQEGSIAILLIPGNFFDKVKPKQLINLLNRFRILERIEHLHQFELTKTSTELIVLKAM